ncbi:polyunsaturated fatty acid 5-lipoxygenase-like [Megalobrama amblycephala]|uniref:polyunsaturated fatty acid 5-lipoxygenase-like n=1 Tax=Megalobrama amblycephala TaxID=75352 RepID=UPI002013C54B|nr:polyunsaturated fatty acid 5-lipoxygenase-like [Megalobrama amblycephala]
MLTYKVLISTDRQRTAETKNSIYLTLLDSNNQSSERTLVKKSRFGDTEREISFDVSAKKDLGDIVQVKLEKEKHFVNFQWFCKHIKVKTPSEKFFEFPCHRWLVGKNEVIIIREGSAQLPQDDTELLKKQRQEELKSRRKTFRWNEWRPGFPMSIDAKMDELPSEVKFDKEKSLDFELNFMKAIGDSFLDKFKGFIQSWKDLADFEKILEDFKIKNTLLENVMQDWSKDYMFGYQFLNGCNPVMIRKCMNLPDNFPVRHEMVDGFLKRGATLQEEIKAGNIYIADYKILDGVPASSTRHYLTAPICLLYKNRLDQILPLAIQLSQNPGEKSPIFLPSDNEYDWMLAKMWVKSSDFNVHQLVTHLLKTHLISEVFEIAMYRQLSAVHPIHTLLKPHVRFTIAINAEAREKLVSDGGVFSKISSIAGAEMVKVIKRAMKTLTYESLCFPEAIKARGMEDMPKYFYRDDGMKIWEAINCFVSAVVEIYYDSDETVQKDVEIQEFVKDVSFGMNNSDKFPKSLKTRKELAEYLTVVIFTASAQHAAVNFGQFDWYGWIPNSPSTMRKPPPEQKGQVDMKYIMDSLPDRGCSIKALGTVWALSQFQKNELFLGTYPDMCFTEQPVKEAIKTFRKKLDEVTNIIKSRNEELTLDYCYLSPDQIPNSVAV